MALGENKKKGPAGRKTADTIRRLESLRKDATRPVSVRLTPEEADAISSYATDHSLRTGQLLRQWIRDRMRDEGLL